MVKSITIFIASLVLISANQVSAAGMYFEFLELEKEGMEASLIIETQKEEINAIEGIVTVAENSEVEEIGDGNSIVSIWLEKPEYNQGNIRFSGIIPGGFNGKGSLFKIKYKSDSASPFELENLRILLNEEDGKNAGIVYMPNKNLGAVGDANLEIDAYPPERFTPEIINDDAIENGRYVLVFSTTDKGSGVEKYQILEKQSDRESSWKDATSPYLLDDQNLNSEIYVRAVDKTGNFIIAYIPAKNPQSYPDKIYWIILLALLILSIGIVLRKKYAKNV